MNVQGTAPTSPQPTTSPAEVTQVDAKKKEVARQFEALFIHQMLKSMRQTIQDGGMSGEESAGRRIFTDMFDQEMAERASHQGGIGLADLVYRHLSPDSQAPGRGIPTLPTTSTSANFAKSQQTTPMDPSQLDSLIAEASATHGVDAHLIRSVIKHESAGNPNAQSKAGAKGLMQLMDGTAREMGVNNSFDPRQNVMGGTRFLKQMLDRFNGDETLALAAYNAGPENVRRYGGVPPFEETRSYVAKVKATVSRTRTAEVGYEA